jgi:hypothetical protein
VAVDRRVIAALKSLTDATRLRLLVELAERPASVEAVAARTGLAPSLVGRHLRRLHGSGLVEVAGLWPHATYRFRAERLAELGRRLAAWEHEAGETREALVAPEGRDVTEHEARLLAGFFEANRLTAIPAQERKRLVVLRYLRDRCFPEDRGYPEKEVNQRLALFHPDAASLRRYLVDAGLMSRASGIYRRVDEGSPG